jgi:hypothetical protein
MQEVYMMNNMIPGAYFFSRDAEQQQLRKAVRGGRLPDGDTRRTDNLGNQWAEAFRQHDPGGGLLASIVMELGLVEK